MTPTRVGPVVAGLVLLAGCASGGSLKETGRVAATGPAADQQATVGMTDALDFVPNVVTAQVGTLTLTVANEGQVPHNLVFRDGRLGSTDTVGGHATATLKVVFAAPGTYRFSCTFHSGMDGQVVVKKAVP